ncbi:polymorphic toxin type 30 domain-containing protein [Auraticoccus cholistanensis]|uniref:polymorphic toxin type 30 domain-containing protein n=1 Tax=Auraticoccus cholistanensis TaxID=2656650 RepID=UPI0038B998D2
MGGLVKALLQLLRQATANRGGVRALPVSSRGWQSRPPHRAVTKPGDPGTPLAGVPSNAQVRRLSPSPHVSDGLEYEWVDAQAKRVRLRVHDRDASAPPGSNAASGPVYRVQVGQRYQRADGTLAPRSAHNPNSPNYDPDVSNDTHIPWPQDLPLPWRLTKR